jgi:hypothetical protein
VDINNTHTSNILAFGGTGSTTRRVSISDADPMIPQKPLKSTFPVKIWFENFLHLNECTPNKDFFCLFGMTLLLDGGEGGLSRLIMLDRKWHKASSWKDTSAASTLLGFATWKETVCYVNALFGLILPTKPKKSNC